MDYKNIPESRAVQSKYGKILHASRPEPPRNHPRMPMSNRAKIFSPFAALRGYEDVAGVLDAVDSINKELRIYTGFINDTGKELPTIIAFEDILEIGVNIT